MRQAIVSHPQEQVLKLRIWRKGQDALLQLAQSEESLNRSLNFSYFIFIVFFWTYTKPFKQTFLLFLLWKRSTRSSL
jgi:hypothetical protein